MVETMAGKKNEFIRIRSDDELKRALKVSSEKNDRQEADEARHILRTTLGLKDDGERSIPSLDHLPKDAQATIERLTHALQHEDAETRGHLLRQLKLMEKAVGTEKKSGRRKAAF